MVEVACVKAWATNLRNQLKSCTDRVQKCIIAASKKKGSSIGEKQDDLNRSVSRYEAIMDAKHNIKLQACKKGMELTPVWKELEESYWKDLKKSRPQDEGKAKVKEMVEQFKKNCMKKITTKSLDPAEFKQDIQKFLKESSLTLQNVFNRTCGFWTTNATILRLVGKADESISDKLQAPIIIICELQKEKSSSSKKDSEKYEQYSQSSTTCCAVENMEGVLDCTVPTTWTTPTCIKVDTCQTTSDQLALQAEDRPIAAPKIGDSIETVSKAGSEVQPSCDQSSITYSAAENVQQEGVQDAIAMASTNQTTPESVKDTCQTTTDHTIEGIQADQLPLQVEERPITAPSLGDIKMKIKIPNVSLQWWERVIAYFRNLFRRSNEQNDSDYSIGESESTSSDIQYSFPVTPSFNLESGTVDNTSEHDSLTISSDSDMESIFEHTELEQKEDSFEPSETDSEFEVESDTKLLLEESNSQNHDDNRPSTSSAYRQWTDEFDEVVDELKVHMEQECDVYFERIKHKVIEYFFLQYRKEVLGRLNAFKTKFGSHLSKEKKRLSELENSIESMSSDYHQLVDEQCQLQELTEQLTYSLSEFYK